MRALRWFTVVLSASLLVVAPVRAQSLIRDAEIEEMMRTFADPLIEAADLRPDSVEIYLIGDATMNAFVTAGQRMFFNAGIITAADLPIELKGVVAHEVGHIRNADLVRQSQGQRAALGPALASIAAGILAAAAGEGGAAAALLASSQQFAALEFFTFTRGIESSADQAAVEFLEATGQSGRGLITFFDRFRDQEVFAQLSLERAQNMEPYFRTHPLSSDRVAALTYLVERQEHRDVEDPPEHVRMLRMSQAKLHGFFNPPERTFQLYSASGDASPALYARAVAHHKLGELDEAVANMETLIAREPENPYFHELLGQIYQENGRPELAIGPYRRAVELKSDNALLRAGLATSLIDVDEDTMIEEAMTHLVVALSIEPNNTYAWYQRSRVHEHRGEEALARYATAELRYATGNARQAYEFARRAQRDLPRGSVEWQRATDIMIATAQVLGDQRGRR